jgi:hypothetical protein
VGLVPGRSMGLEVLVNKSFQVTAVNTMPQPPAGGTPAGAPPANGQQQTRRSEPVRDRRGDGLGERAG